MHKIFLICSIVLISSFAYAGNFQGMEITANKVDDLFTYEIVLKGYRDPTNTVNFGGLDIDFGDGEKKQFFIDEFNEDTLTINSRIRILNYKISHTYAGPGIYLIRIRSFNREPGVLNMQNSVNHPIYAEAKLVVDPVYSNNHLPEFITPPIHFIPRDQKFNQSYKAYDRDGDSLSYELIVPQQDSSLQVLDYSFPDNPAFGETRKDSWKPAIFEIDPATGMIYWDYPQTLGKYTIAVKVIEWKKVNDQWQAIGHVTRDVMLEVVEDQNMSPELIIPKDTFIVAGETLNVNLSAIDPEQDTTSLFIFGEPLIDSRATYQQLEAESPSIKNIEFNWSTNTELVRDTPYELFIYTSDKGNPDQSPAYQLKPWHVWIVNQKPDLNAPSALTVSFNEAGQMVLSWQDNSDNEQYFLIEISQDGETFLPLKTVAANAGQAVIESIYCAGTYTFRIKAVFASVNSDYSNTAEVTAEERAAEITAAGNELIASPAERYRWFINDEELIPETQRIKTYATGIYTVELTDLFNCTTSVSTQNVITYLDISEPSYIFYPNPVDDFIYLQKVKEPVYIQIYDESGKLLKNSRWRKAIDVSSFTPGIYYLKLIQSSRQQTFKLVKR